MPPFFQRDSPVLLFVSVGSLRNHHSDSGRSIEDSPILLVYLPSLAHLQVFYEVFVRQAHGDLFYSFPR